MRVILDFDPSALVALLDDADAGPQGFLHGGRRCFDIWVLWLFGLGGLQVVLRGSGCKISYDSFQLAH